MLDFETSNSKSDLEIKFVGNYFFLENYVTSEGAVSQNVFFTINLSPYMQIIILSIYQ